MRNGGTLTARQLARDVLERVELDGAYANRALLAALDRAPAMAADDRALATEIVYGVLRRHGRLERALGALATSGLDRLDPRARIAMRAGAYQILFLDRIPAYAAVDDTAVVVKAIVVSPDGARAATAEIDGRADEPEAAGNAAAEQLLASGASQILEDVLRQQAAVEGLQP